ncbi:serine hydrolase, partial [Nonomuraea monospora]|uniref:serine hydrolase n=1 Tax=Nonomuraea monospora TaxID=568818 RepID=UPI0031D5DDFC
MSLTLSEQDQHTLRTAAWGAVALMSAAGAAGSAHRAGTQAGLALTSATGLTGHVLAKAPSGLNHKSVAGLADQVLPALTASVSLLRQQNRAEAGNFRRTVLVAVEAATQGKPSPTMTEMARKITEALDAGQDRPELRTILQELVDAGIVGVTLRVNDPHGEWTASAGLAELGGTAEPPLDGHVRIGSNTKTFTATVVLALVAEGKIA